ncbi:ferrous iron transport protein B [Patescibacteria group bacterium]|nr:ferrous iron transport protein B [Patescibacteria group bacterium]
MAGSLENKLIVGLIGNPNVGKTTLFNALTGASQHVGNWPGKTVEKKEGEFESHGQTFHLVDLPGAYSLAPYSEEEQVTSFFVIKEEPDVIVQIIDAGNLERNLYLTVQLLELGSPLVIALNLIGQAKEEGITIKYKALAELLGVPVVPINAKSKEGLGKLLTAIKKRAPQKRKPALKLRYGRDVTKALVGLKKRLNQNKSSAEIRARAHWYAIKLLEGTAEKDFSEDKKIISLAERSRKRLQTIFRRDASLMIAHVRYGFVRGLGREVIVRKKNKSNKKWLERIDELLLHKYFGIPIFLTVSLLIFQIAFSLSKPLTEGIGWIFKKVGVGLEAYLEASFQTPWLTSLLVDGVLGGVGAVLSFVPTIALIFLLLALLEDSGYMSRVAFVMDRFMHKIGLHGKAFLPLILGFGCNVPAIMATRILKTKRDRLQTILMMPLVACSARLPIFVLFAGVFFSAYQGLIVFSIYLLSIMLTILMGLILQKFYFKKLSTPFVIELPHYRVPSFQGLMIHVGERTWSFVKKAGTVILVFSIIIWFLGSVPFSQPYASQDSLAGQIGQTISPIFEPLGFGFWQASTALLFGFAAKEVVVSTLSTYYSVDEDNTEGLATLRQDFTPLSAYSFMVFSLIYVPCLPALYMMKKETGSWKWPVVAVGYLMVLAWVVAFVVYQGGRVLGF